MRNWATVMVLVLLAAGLYAGLQMLDEIYSQPGPSEAPVRINIESGRTLRGVIMKLAQAGVLEHPRAVQMYLRVHGREPHIKAGRYEIPPRASPAQILSLLQSGAVLLEQLTIVEGSTFAQFRHALETHPEVRVTLRNKSDAEVMAAIGHPGEPPEGRFFPDTYRFAARTTDAEILKLAYEKMRKLLGEAWTGHAANLPIHTPYEALILASIVEKETALPSERPVIAGVFMTRLRRGMPLQSDPTVIYGLGAAYDGDIHTRDLRTDTPYNTYTRMGLPPTPIALPGRESVLATVSPNETGALFFAALGDGSGAHHFSKTLEEHNEAVRRLVAKQRILNRRT